MYFDTHAHYDDRRFDGDRDEILASMPENGVSLIVNPGCSAKSSRKALELAERYPFMYAAAGVHPSDVPQMKDADLGVIKDLASHEKCVAIGEIGLDYHYDFSPPEAQKKRFCDQLQLARELGLPAIVHDRDAHRDCLEIVKEFRDVRGVYHCFSGSLESAREILSLGWYLSFTGTLTFKNARHAPDVVRYMPLDRLMIETDAPYLTPEPYRSDRNDSRYVSFVCKAAATIKRMTLEDMAEATMKNGLEFFGIRSGEKA